MSILQNEKEDSSRATDVTIDVTIVDVMKNLIAEYVDSENQDEFECTLVMVAAIYMGPKSHQISRLTGIPEKNVRVVEHRLRYSRLWIGDTLAYQDWKDEQKGAVSFILDALVAQGLAIRTPERRLGEYVYRAIPFS